MHPSLSSLEHRPWPVLEKAWRGRQSWHDLLFAHWPIEAAALQRFVPKELKIDEFEGTSWIGVVPFRMEGVTARGLPSLPYFSNFTELNLRIYVSHNGKPGVWFLSLDAGNIAAVIAAQGLFNLPYKWANMKVRCKDNTILYDSNRYFTKIKFKAQYKPVSDIYQSKKGTLENWLTERYCLYARKSGKLLRLEIHHLPWPLQRAEAEIEVNDLFEPFDLKVPNANPILHFSKSIDVIGWWPVII